MTSNPSTKDVAQPQGEKNMRLSDDDDFEEEQEEDNSNEQQEQGSEVPLNRPERRRLERDSRKDGRQNENSSQETQADSSFEGEEEQVLDEEIGQRPPKVSSRFDRDQEQDLSVLDDPAELYSEPGEDLLEGRFEQVRDTGVLDPLVGSNVYQREQTKLNNTINAFVAWQAAQDKYYIYLNGGYDKKAQKDRWLPKVYRFNPLTMGNQLRLNRLAAVVDDLRRAVNNNDQRVTNANIKLQSSVEKLMKVQCQIFFRMDIDREFMIAHFNDINLMVQAAIYCSAQVPQSQRTRWSNSSSKTRPNHIR